MKVGIRLGLLATLLLGGCSRPEPKAAPVSVRFSGDSIRQGNQYRGLDVTRVDLQRTMLQSAPYAGSVSFRGELELRGEYRPHFDADVKEPCFWVDATDGEKLPRIDFDTRKPWFCFSNQADAIRQLGTLGDTAHATIVVDDYTTHIAQSDVWDVARLVRVVTKD